MKRAPMLGLAVLLAACAGGSRPAAPASPAAARLPRIVSTDTLAAWQQKGPVLLLDVRTDVFTYLSGHLPGAEYLNTETVRASRGGMPTQLLEPAAYAALFSRLGVRMDQPVVIYSAGETHNIDATFLAWLLAGFGHPAVYVLDGGYFKWQLEQRPIARKYPRIPESHFPDGPFHPEAADLADVQAALSAKAVLLVDARPPDQYAGEAGSQMRRGHIPGAVNHYWQSDLTREGFGFVWKDSDQLRRDYAAQGITPDRDIIAYCNSATEASHVHFTLRYLLGYPRVRVYVGSWTEWAEREDLPIATGP
ncbi:MAG TPA: sulfurtransferase [Gemmatimonadales bacterium]|nr:sulfurtransferase [Gemmatimonadales bacterium]